MEAVTGLLSRVEKTLGHEPLSEHKRLDLVSGGRQGSVSCIATLAGRVVGYAHVACDEGRTPRRCGMEIVAEPGPSSEVIVQDLTRAGLASVSEDGGGQVHLWARHATELDDERAARLGFSHGRDLLQMTVALPLQPPPPLLWAEGISLRTFRPGRDENSWLEVNRRAFASHPEQGGWDRDTLEQRKSEPWFDPAGFLIATDGASETGDRIAGFCWTKVHPGATGEIYVIAVDDAYLGKGLGRSLVLAGLASLAERGMTTGMLYVDGSNTAAVSLYRSVGFEVHHVDRAYVIEIEPPVG